MFDRVAVSRGDAGIPSVTIGVLRRAGKFDATRLGWMGGYRDARTNAAVRSECAGGQRECNGAETVVFRRRFDAKERSVRPDVAVTEVLWLVRQFSDVSRDDTRWEDGASAGVVNSLAGCSSSDRLPDRPGDASLAVSGEP